LSADVLTREAGDIFWRALFRPESLARGDAAGLAGAAARFAGLTSPALAAFLLERASRRLGASLVDARLVEHSRLEARFTRAAQLQCVRAIDAAGIPAVYLKGFANAHTLYPDPDLRLFGDLDILVRQPDLGRVIGLLTVRGFTFRPDGLQPWGFQAEGSFVPFASADDSCNLDLHLVPDGPPIDRALTTERVFRNARRITAGSLTFSAPSLEHTLVLCLSNAAKDKLGPFAVRKLVDLLRLLGTDAALDWTEITALLVGGRLLGPARAIFALLRRLGAPLPELPAALARAPGWPAARELDLLVDDYRTLFATAPGAFAVMRREFLLSAGPCVALRRNARRLAGLVRPRSGLPPGLQAGARE
jgi:hypothetical protein